ncbi:MAG TPA: type II secretion system F family protein [Pyrinomonadaceae bacterium]|jgi:tight adherence protein C|nr:type II secretion system F family protein [Pyrinomonadaceae bacterium]
MLLVITISTFVCITFGVVGIYWLISRPQSAATERLREMNKQSVTATAGPVSITQESPGSDFAERIAAPITRLAPASAAEARKLQKQLMQAGFRGPSAPVIYRALQLSSMICFPGLVALGCAVLARPLGSASLFILLAFLVGFVLPRYVLGRMIRGRQQRVRWGLADALDLMVVSIEAGLGLNASMLRISEELKDVHPDISEEFEMANLEIRVGREREEALRNLAERTGVDDLRSLVAMLIQADRFGTSIARAVRVFSDSLRTKRRQRAEQAAQKAAVKLLIPLACFLFPTLFIAILGPAALQLMDTLKNM